jgi:hypothetical protein
MTKDKKKDKKKETKKTGKNKDVMSRREKRTIPVKLEDKEIAKHARDYSKLLDKVKVIEEEKKTADAEFKRDIQLLEESAGKLLAIISTGTEDRELAVDVVYDWPHKEVRVVRVDNEEVITKRTMTAEESQKEIFDVNGKPNPKDRSEVKDAKKPGDEKPGGRRTPVAGEIIEVETRAGWKTGKVLPSSGSVLDVEVEGEAEPLHIPVEAQIWRWPQKTGEMKPAEGETKVGEDETDPTNGETLKASVGEQAAAKKGRGKKRWDGDENSEQLDF